ncbi:hypothetical protein ABT010_13140 [Streptomyces sp. NPDC002668]|uniref:hypothetical protein n=1 Tax=Streptomyces sp. NPDC002668 TaxID=3154422 RepID=UPI00332F2CB8
MTAADLARVDVPLPVVAEQAGACAVLRDAMAHTRSPSDQLAYALDAYLVTHPDVPVSTDDDYPAWAADLAARTANQTRRTS